MWKMGVVQIGGLIGVNYSVEQTIHTANINVVLSRAADTHPQNAIIRMMAPAIKQM